MVLFSVIVNAQIKKKRNKKRIFNTESADNIEKNHLQIENVFMFENNFDAYNNFFVPDINLTYGTGFRSEVFIDVAVLNSNNQTGILPITLGFKTNLIYEKKYLPEINLFASVQTKDLGSRIYRNSNYLPEVSLILQKKLPNKTSGEFEYGLQWIDGIGQPTKYYNLSFETELILNFSIQYGFNYLNNSDADNFGVAEIGFSKEFVKNNLEINIMYGKYLKNDSQNYYLGIGCNKNFKLNK